MPVRSAPENLQTIYILIITTYRPWFPLDAYRVSVLRSAISVSPVDNHGSAGHWAIQLHRVLLLVLDRKVLFGERMVCVLISSVILSDYF